MCKRSPISNNYRHVPVYLLDKSIKFQAKYLSKIKETISPPKIIMSDLQVKEKLPQSLVKTNAIKIFEN